MKIYIKNMVCNRCIMVVKSELENMGYTLLNISLGVVEFKSNLSAAQKLTINNRLRILGFELIDDKKSRLIEKIKSLIIELVQNHDSKLKDNLSALISHELNHDYTYLSNLFSQVEGMTIEKFFIAQKIEKVKELLVYDELSLSEIAFRLHYSNVAHLSSQFKKVTGVTPSHFKNIRDNKRRSLDEV
ncbi:MAG: helix-turn-helix transcriptional regulator [Bacteroidetes bacterium]|nr:helix-turn-helix transcriptional regulator [Bacteroidota bacterium]